MKRLKIHLLRTLWAVLFPIGVMAQSYSGYNWYFGNSTQGIRFSRSDNSATLATSQAVPFGTGGSAVASNTINGDLFFYTDGSNVYDVSNTVMPQGTGLGANTSANQPVVIGKVPGSDTQYFIIVNTANFTTAGSLSTRIIDMAAFGNAAFPTPALGDATSATNSAPFLTGRSEAMITIPHANGDNFWLISHASGSPDYTVTLFTASGPTTSTTFSGVGLIDYVANFAYHPGSNLIAVSPQQAGRNVEVVTFDPATGVLAFDQSIPNTAVSSTTNQAIYDTEFSGSGKYLYISRHGQAGIPADVQQYDLSNPTNSLVSVLPQPSTIFRSYGLQMAPDSTIYHIYQATSGGPFLVGQISDTDSVASNVIYRPQAFSGNQNFNATQFPSFAPRDTVSLDVTFTAEGLCANSATGFFPTVTPGADSLRWDFGDGSGSSDWSPVYTYTAGGSYNVSVIAFLNGQQDTTTLPLTITDFDTQISLVQDTTACSCELPFPKNPPTSGSGSCTMFSVTANVNGSGNPSPSMVWSSWFDTRRNHWNALA